MPINATPEYFTAERRFREAQTDEERVSAMEDVLREMPKHKSAETLRRQLRTRYKKLKEKLARIKSQKKGGGKPGIKKGDIQCVLIGFTNSGKSSLFQVLTGKEVKIASYGFTTAEPETGMMEYEGAQIQLIDMPPVASEGFDSSLANTADTIILVVEKVHEIPDLQTLLKKSQAKKIIAFNKIDLYDPPTQRKIKETLRSKRYNFILVSTKKDEGIPELKEKIFKSFNKIRVYTKQPGKSEHEPRPVILKPGSTLEDVAEKVLRGFAKNVRRARIWGPSSKFGGQEVGLKHKLKDKDVVEFQTK